MVTVTDDFIGFCSVARIVSRNPADVARGLGPDVFRERRRLLVPFLADWGRILHIVAVPNSFFGFLLGVQIGGNLPALVKADFSLRGVNHAAGDFAVHASGGRGIVRYTSATPSSSAVALVEFPMLVTTPIPSLFSLFAPV